MELASLAFWIIVLCWCLHRRIKHVNASVPPGKWVNQPAQAHKKWVPDDEEAHIIDHHDVEDVAYGAVPVKGEVVLVNGSYVPKTSAGSSLALQDAGHIDHPSTRGVFGFINALMWVGSPLPSSRHIPDRTHPILLGVHSRPVDTFLTAPIPS